MRTISRSSSTLWVRTTLACCLPPYIAHALLLVDLSTIDWSNCDFNFEKLFKSLCEGRPGLPSSAFTLHIGYCLLIALPSTSMQIMLGSSSSLGDAALDCRLPPYEKFFSFTSYSSLPYVSTTCGALVRRPRVHVHTDISCCWLLAPMLITSRRWSTAFSNPKTPKVSERCPSILLLPFSAAPALWYCSYPTPYWHASWTHHPALKWCPSLRPPPPLHEAVLNSEI